MKQLLLATNNAHKVSEIKAIFDGIFQITTLEEQNIVIDPEENGKNFEENALIKARAISSLTRLPVLADDTGLCVEALNGAPGVNSARYAVSHDDAANRHKLLAELNGKNDRSAYFETVVVLRFFDGEEICGFGRVDGCILQEERGQAGFGYDSLFFSDELQKTFAEASQQEKNSVSHRSRALHDLLSKLKQQNLV